MLNRLILTLSLLALGSLSALAQSTTISGKVTDSTGAAITGATVKALNLGSNRETTAQTNAGGEYRLSDLPAGSYRISATADGFGASAESLTVDEAAITQNFSLSPGAIGDTITVTAGKGSGRVASETPQTVTVATEFDLEQRRPASTLEALERSPSLITTETNPARARPNLRGFSGPRVLVVIDGERLNNSRTDALTGISVGIVDVTQLASAEVVGGSGSSLYGSDSIGGTINLITKAPIRPDSGSVLGIRFDGNYYSQGRNRRGAVTVNYANQYFATRLSGSLFRNANYRTGSQDVPLSTVLAAGQFSLLLNNSPANYTVWSLPARAEILNGQGHGFNDQADVWFFLSKNHSIRGRALNSQHFDLGNAFSGPPYEIQDRYSGFRRLDKYGVRYEGLEIAPWLARLTGGYYRQKLSFPQDQITNSIRLGSSYVTTPAPARFTGDPSTFIRVDFTMNKNSVTTNGADVQASLLPFSGMILTTGFQYFRDESFDEFERFAYNQTTGAVNPATLIRGASTPRTFYGDKAFFAQAEFDKVRWLRLSGGVRVDKWSTEAQPTTGFPLGAEFSLLRAALPILAQNPGPLAPQVNSFGPITQLAGGQGSANTSSTAVTGNVGAVLRLPGGVNPYFRWSNSYREPSVSERYLIRNFIGFPNVLSAVVVGNPLLEPETGQNYEAGVKVQQRRFNASFGYFRNRLKNLIVFASPVFNPPQSIFGNTYITIPADPAIGALGSPANGGRHSIQINGRINQASNLIYGFESTFEGSIGLGIAGSLTPFGSMSWLHGTNESPTTAQLNIVRQFFNRGDLPFKFEGSESDVPLANITPFRGLWGVQYNDVRATWFIEYTARHQARVKRVNPSGFEGNLVNYGSFASLNAFTRHAVKGGYTWRKENYRMQFTVGIDNLTDKLYWEHFQNAPAPGLAYVFGMTLDFFNLLKK
ncbi:MAG: TonB-dependent receptor [Blastocatellia bacterium]